MSKSAYAHDETEELVFHKPRTYRKAGNFLALGFLGLLLINIYVDHLNASIPDSDRIRAEFNRIAPKILDVAFTIMGLCSLYLGGSYTVRFDAYRGTYEIQDGWFPFRWTTRGTMADIDSIYAAKSSSSGNIGQVRIRWKRGGWHWYGSSTLVWDQRLADAEEKAQKYAQMLGVPLGPTTAYGRQRRHS